MTNKPLVATLAIALGILVASVTWIVARPANGQLRSTPNIMQSLEGIWTTPSNDSVVMTAEIKQNMITIMWGSKDDKSFSSLYWRGSFLYPAQFDDGTTVLSHGDVEPMKASLMGSQDTAKTFTYKDGKLSFKFTAMGVTRALQLEPKG